MFERVARARPLRCSGPKCPAKNRPRASGPWSSFFIGFSGELVSTWAFFSGDEKMDYAGRATRGLALPDGVLRKIFRENALRWLPGLDA